jgi:hypothetical protein
MDQGAYRKTLEDLKAEVLADDSPLCWRITRELADYTVAFVVANDGVLTMAGTGTLVSFRDSHYFLTAAHVWEKKLKDCESIRIPLKGEAPCRFAISPEEIVPYGGPIPACWNEWGPDIALLRIPPERVGSFIAAGRPFYPLSMKRERLLGGAVGELWFLMGAPALRGKITLESAIPELQGMNVIPDGSRYSGSRYSSINLPPEYRAQFDFVDFSIDTSLPDVVPDFKGVSGGGLWRVYVFKNAEGQTESFKILDGVVFWQEPIAGGMLLRCHGPQSLGVVLCRLYD